MAERNQNSSKRGAGDNFADAKEQARATVEEAKAAARETIAQAREQAGAAGEAVQRQAGRIGDQMREAAESLLHEQKDRMAEAVHGFAEALRRAADSLEHEDKAMAARYADQAADRIDRFSTTMRERDLGEMMANAEAFARRRPSLFIAGAVAAGFVVGRLLTRASDGAASGYAGASEHHPSYQPGGEAMAGYGVGSSGGAEKI